MRMGERDNQKDTEDEIEVDVEEDEELAEEVRDAETTSSSTPGEGDGVVLGDGLVVIRQPKQSDADLATAEVSTSASSDLGRVIVPLIMAAALSLGALLLQRHWRSKKRRRGPAKAQTGPDYSKLVDRLSIKSEGVTSSHLKGRTVIISDLMLNHDSEAASSSEGTSQPLKALLESGAEITGCPRTEERSLGLLGQHGDALNAALPESIASGTGSGVAMAAAAGLADIGFGVDHLSGPRVHAACSGIWGYRASTGTGPTDSSGRAAGLLDALGWASRDPKSLQLVADALSLPGTVSKGDLLQVIVAEDLYNSIGESLDILKRATYNAARRWAGQEEVARARMMSFLYDACPSAHFFMQDPEDDRGIMEGLRAAAVAVQAADFSAAHERLLDQPGSTAPELLQELKQAAKVDAAAVEQGRKVMNEASTQLREILVAGNLLILPALPGPPPRRDSPQEELEAWQRSTLQLSCLATLAGLPQVNVPVVLPDQAPMAVAIVGLQRSDRRLLAAAQQLGPLIQEAAAKLAAGRATENFSPGASSASSSPSKPLMNSSASKKQSPGKGSAAAAAQKEAAHEQAEAHKTVGNVAFQAGAYEEAVKAYTQAIEAKPKCAVWYSNRALAYLKLMQFDAAEADCNKALKLELNVKTLLRRGTARRGKQDADGARRDFKHALELEPNNRQARQDLQKLKEEEETLRAFSAHAVPHEETNGHSAAAEEAVFL